MPDEIVKPTQMFADETKLYTDVKNKEEWYCQIRKLGKKWQIKFNATKCKVMHIVKENIQC